MIREPKYGWGATGSYDPKMEQARVKGRKPRGAGGGVFSHDYRIRIAPDGEDSHEVDLWYDGDWVFLTEIYPNGRGELPYRDAEGRLFQGLEQAAEWYAEQEGA